MYVMYIPKSRSLDSELQKLHMLLCLHQRLPDLSYNSETVKNRNKTVSPITKIIQNNRSAKYYGWKVVEK